MTSTRCYLKIFLMAGIALSFSGCASLSAPEPQLTPLQIQTMQTRTYAATKRQAFDAVMTAFQDSGYTIETSNYRSGYIRAKGLSHSTTYDNYEPSDSDDSNDKHSGKFVDILLDAIVNGDKNESGSEAVTSTLVANAYVTKAAGQKSKIRLNYIKRKVTSSGHGQQSEDDKRILKANTYQKTFNQIAQAMFVSSAK